VISVRLEIAIPDHFESSGISGLISQISRNSGISLYSNNMFQNSIPLYTPTKLAIQSTTASLLT
jgi:hypothetical protein